MEGSKETNSSGRYQAGFCEPTSYLKGRWKYLALVALPISMLWLRSALFQPRVYKGRKSFANTVFSVEDRSRKALGKVKNLRSSTVQRVKEQKEFLDKI